MAFEEIKQEGRMAYAKGLGLSQNPYYRRERMPRATGEEFLVWHQKIDAWEAGWGEAAIERQALSQPPSNGRPAEQNALEGYR